MTRRGIIATAGGLFGGLLGRKAVPVPSFNVLYGGPAVPVIPPPIPPHWLSKHCLEVLKADLAAYRAMNEWCDSHPTLPIGSTITVRKPQRYAVKEGANV